jgi:hypothetical protein
MIMVKSLGPADAGDSVEGEKLGCGFSKACVAALPGRRGASGGVWNS